jgi:hypothetical protein
MATVAVPAAALSAVTPLRYGVLPVQMVPAVPVQPAGAPLLGVYQSKSLHLSRIVSVIKALRGDVWGEFVTSGLVLGDFDSVSTIDCRLPNDALGYLAPVMRLDYAVTPECTDQEPGQPWSGCLRVHLPGSGSGPLRLRVLAAPRCALRSFDAHFDIDMLSVDGDRMYLRFSSPTMRMISDRLSFVVSRVRSRRFCLLDGPSTSADQGRQLRRAGELVASRAWHMDDMLGGRTRWVAATWAALLQSPRSVRLGEQPNRPHHKDAAADAGDDASHPCRHTECALCHESFAQADVVVNLSCNHNFHVFCPCGAGGGLCVWLDSHSTCPICRASVV